MKRPPSPTQAQIPTSLFIQNIKALEILSIYKLMLLKKFFLPPLFLSFPSALLAGSVKSPVKQQGHQHQGDQ